MAKKRNFALLLGLGTAIALAAGGGAAYWFVKRQSPDTAMPVGADIVPQNALMTVSFSTDAGQWRQLRQFGTSETQAIFDQNLAQLRDRLLTANGYSYQTDIQPWVGDEITVAFLSDGAPSVANGSASPVPPSSSSQSMVMILPIANPASAQQILTQKQNSASELAAKTYQGIQIRSFKGNTDQNYFSTVLDQRLVVISTAEKAIERVIDTEKGADAIIQTPGYRQALSHISAPQPFARVFVNVPVANTMAAANSTQPLPTQGLNPLQNNQGLAATITLEPQGIRFQGIGWLNPDSSNHYKVINNAERIPGLLPATTLLMTSGGNLKQLWQDYSQRAASAPKTALSPDRLRQGIRSTTGLDLDQDLISWMDGEFSLALVPATGAGNAQGVGLLILAQTSDRRAADAALTKLDQAMSNRYKFKVSQGNLAGKPVVNWMSPFAAVGVTRGWLDGNVAFLTLGAPIASLILPQPDKTLATDPLFQAATASQLDPNNGHFFANLDRLTSADSVIPLPVMSPEITSFLRAMRTVGVTAAVQDDRAIRYDLFVMLKKTENSKPLPAPNPIQSP
jgi:Protein of unknown function (DUF3352)